jgi:hypothetical protein
VTARSRNARPCATDAIGRGSGPRSVRAIDGHRKKIGRRHRTHRAKGRSFLPLTDAVSTSAAGNLHEGHDQNSTRGPPHVESRGVERASASSGSHHPPHAFRPGRRLHRLSRPLQRA